MSYGKNLGWKIEYSEEVAEDLRKLGRPAQQRIKKFLEKLLVECGNPKERGEPYRGNLAGCWKYRAGNYRLICKILDGEVIVLCVLMASHRSKSYAQKSIEDLLKRISELKAESLRDS